MSEVTESVNWSAIACAAFQAHLAMLAIKKPYVQMQEVIERLKASKELGEAKSLTFGERAGRQWAAKRANADELQCLANAWDRIHNKLFEAGAAHLQFFRVINSRPMPNEKDAAAFWRDATGEEKTPDDTFVEAFASGAINLWQEVRHQL